MLLLSMFRLTCSNTDGQTPRSDDTKMGYVINDTKITCFMVRPVAIFLKILPIILFSYSPAPMLLFSGPYPGGVIGGYA